MLLKAEPIHACFTNGWKAPHRFLMFRSIFCSPDDLGPCVQVEKGGIIVDFGCGVGVSTRLLADNMPHARRVIGIDLSPYMLAVGKHHNQEKNVGKKVSLLYGDVADTRLPNGTASLVSCTYLLHEMPDEAVRCVYFFVTAVVKFVQIFLVFIQEMKVFLFFCSYRCAFSKDVP